MKMTQDDEGEKHVPTGISGLDRILIGGYPAGRIMLVEGAPGTGKTTLALQFLIEGARRGKKAMFFSIAQSHLELDMIAESHGFDMSQVDTLTPELGHDGSSRVFSVDSDQADLVGLMDELNRELDKHKPDLFVFDSLLELRLLTQQETHYRRELLALRRKLREIGCTSLLVDHLEPQWGERNAEGIVHGVIKLDSVTPPIGVVRQRLTVTKLRGAPFVQGYHDFRIGTGGMVVYPRVIPKDAEPVTMEEMLEPSHDGLRDMLGGGLEFGSTLLIAGQSGTGKSTLATVLASDAGKRGLTSAMFLFEERTAVLRQRSRQVGIELAEQEEHGRVLLQHFDPAELSTGEFSNAVLSAVNEGARVIVIDSLSGYLEALPDQSHALIHLHTLIKHLAMREVLVIVTISQSGLLGEPPATQLNSSFIADSVILLRQYESNSEIRRSIAVLKKRQGDHLRNIQELVIRPGAVEIRHVSAETEKRTKSESTLGGS
ncbi:ATPase domain-containing protein [Roseisalinus antarcticus]|uniref:non-specific serine/threonine protein kinase n=1 Tax=Roseisalinus antarcticus TaxID=254357 RepID=A0A1Y5TX42_9RHOB|nr:ATPase domain-containing protein [Roseisalinus antarcticus]SLN75630.1 Circadian clock protein kinase KaiC [Roseisalinus antarcticus]